jgi:hypothetical protein
LSYGLLITLQLLPSIPDTLSAYHACRSSSQFHLLSPDGAHIVSFDDLKVPFIKDVIQEKSMNHHDKLGNHSNPILQPLLEQQQRRRLKKLWPAGLTDG